MKVRVNDRQRKAKLNLAWIKSLIDQALRFEGRPEAEVSVLLVDDEGIRELNRRYRGLDQPTDCLAFSQREGRDPEVNPNLLGDIVVSVETALVQSKTYKQSLKKEISLYLIHGLLHLLGYDDTEPSDRKRMSKRQEELLEKIVKKAK